MIEFKGLRESLTLRRVRPELIKILRLCAMWSNRSGQDIRITSLNDHDHSDTSLHYEDLAVDLQVLTATGSPNFQAMAALAKYLRRHLGPSFDTVHGEDAQHARHIHLEYDDNERPRKNAN